MSGPAGFSKDRDAAERARAQLDAAAAVAAAAEDSQRELLRLLLDMVAHSSWLAAGCRTAKQWLRHYTNLSGYEAMRFEQTAKLGHRHPELAEALLSGRVAMKRAWILAGVVTAERAPHLAPVLAELLKAAETAVDDEEFKTAVVYWATRVDEITNPAGCRSIR